MKKLDVPARDAMVIVGHSRSTVTQEIYTHVDDGAQCDALDTMHGLWPLVALLALAVAFAVVVSV